MPHYKDGTEAKLGDIVKGKGYNIKDESGNLKEIAGIVHNLSLGQTSCNVQILLVRPMNENELKESIVPGGFLPYYANIIGNKLYHLTIEYGQCDHFEKV